MHCTIAPVPFAHRKGNAGKNATGTDLRAAVLGANDGLVSNFCLIMGVAGAGTGNTAILLTGFAGLVAGACSTALGEWLSVTNARELARTQIAKEADELEHTPDAERHELALIYQAKGLDGDEAKRVAAQIMRDKVKALDTLTREELGLDPAELGGNPWSAAAVSFCLFSPVSRLRCSDLGTLRRLRGYAISHRLHDPCVSVLFNRHLGCVQLHGVFVPVSVFSGGNRRQNERRPEHAYERRPEHAYESAQHARFRAALVGLD